MKKIRYVLLLCCLNSFGLDVKLYTNGVQSYRYKEKIQNAIDALGTQKVFLVFSEGTKIEVVDHLGAGGQAQVFETKDGNALRVRKNRYAFISFNPIDGTKSMDSIGEYLESYAFYKSNDVKVGKVYLKKSRYGEFIMAKRYEIQYELYDLLDMYDSSKKSKIPVKDFERIKNEFVEMSKSSWKFKQIGDLRTDQIVYTKSEGWILLDFTRDHMIISPLEIDSSENAFVQGVRDKAMNTANLHSPGGAVMIMKPSLPAQLEAEVNEAIKLERKSKLRHFHGEGIVDGSWRKALKSVQKVKGSCWAWLTKVF